MPLSYAVDLVLCIDATQSMAPILEEVKANALNFHEQLLAELAARQKVVDQLRLRVIGFRDIRDHGANALHLSPFFVLPRQNQEFASFVRGLHPIGGGTTFPESSLVALALAIHSEWTSIGDRRRHVITLWTDDAPNDLEDEFRFVSQQYAGLVPHNLDELTDLWESGQGRMQASARRLILFCPNAPAWDSIASSWDNVVHVSSIAGRGLSDHHYQEILQTVGNSV